MSTMTLFYIALFTLWAGGFFIGSGLVLTLLSFRLSSVHSTPPPEPPVEQ